MRRSAEFDRRDQLVEVAVLAFSELGWFGCRLDDIAQRAGITKAVILRHWDSKESLFLEVRLRLAERTRGRIEQAVRGAEVGPQRDAQAVVAVMDFLEDTPGGSELLGGIRSTRAPDMPGASDDLLLEVASIFGFGSPAGPDDVVLLRDAATVGLCVGLSSGPTTDGRNWSTPLSERSRSAVNLLSGGKLPKKGIA